MSAERRIAALFRELAEQFERLEEERQPPKRKRFMAPPPTPPAPQAIAVLERGLRRAGLKT